MAEDIRALLLDFDHTLTDFGDHVPWADARPALHALYAEAGVSEDFLAAHAGSIGLYTAVAAHEPLPTARLREVQRRAAAILEELERGGIERTQALPGARELLEALPVLGLRAAIVTSNSASVVRTTLRRLSHLPSTPSILRHIDVIVGRSEVTRLKPDPEGLLAACRLLGVAPASAAYLGDGASDIEAAVSAGLLPWGITTGLGTESELRAAGAAEVFAGLGDALASLERQVGAGATTTAGER